MDTEDVVVKVLCLEGKRDLVFKSATGSFFSTKN
jgi:hypothetical protein